MSCEQTGGRNDPPQEFVLNIEVEQALQPEIIEEPLERAVLVEQPIHKNKKGRPKGCTKASAKRREEEEDDWSEHVQRRYKQEESLLEGYINIVQFLRKINYEGYSRQHKMNPYNALTANCFWYMVSAEYFSFDFFKRGDPLEVAQRILDKVQELPIQLPTRVLKMSLFKGLLSFETEELVKVGVEMADKLSSMIQPPVHTRNVPLEKKMALTTVAEDYYFISSVRTLAYKQLSRKIKSSYKWSNQLAPYFRNVNQLLSKKMPRPKRTKLAESSDECEDEHKLYEVRLLHKRNIVVARMVNQKEGIFEDDQMTEGKEAVMSIKKSRYEDILGNNMSLNVEKYLTYEGHKRENYLNNCSEKECSNEIGSTIKNEIYVSETPPKRILNSAEYQMPYVPPKLGYKNSCESEEDYIIKYYDKYDILLDAILHMPLEKVISVLQSSLPTPRLPYIYESFMPIPTNDPLEFIYQLHPDEEKYLEYLKMHQRKLYRSKVKKSETIIEEEEREGQYEDAKCQICTDGDYTEDNLIVFCSMCNISLHQRCVELAKVPAENWICDVCLAFGPAGINLPCPLCNVKGGAMKRTGIHIDNLLFKDNNPSYYYYSRQCQFTKSKEYYIYRDYAVSKRNRYEGYYDYFVKSTYLPYVPVCHFVWVHYVCAIWIPECYFYEKNGILSVKGIENIEKKRYRTPCFVCKYARNGAAVKCDETDCEKYYHPYCARKKKVYMEQLNLDKLKYLIFCEYHEPLRLTRQIYYKKKKTRYEIVKFARMIEKYIETYKIAHFPYKLLKTPTQCSFLTTEPRVVVREEKRHHTSRTSDEEFIKQLMISVKKSKGMKVILKADTNGYIISEIYQPSKREIRKCLSRYDEFWNTLQNGCLGYENYKRYYQLIENPRFDAQIEAFLNDNLSLTPKQPIKEKKVGKKRGKHATVEVSIEDEGGIFCICRRPYYRETDMFECDVCGYWYHHSCLGFLGSEKDAQDMYFHCMKCLKYEDKYLVKTRIAKCEHLFKNDSNFLTYRPPTPDLLTEDEVEAPEPLRFKIDETIVSLEKPFIVYSPTGLTLQDNKKTEDKPLYIEANIISQQMKPTIEEYPIHDDYY